jgi:hypothetical protein
MATGYGGYPPAEDAGLGARMRHLGDRVWRRAEPRFGITLAGVGVLMVIVGVIVWATDRALEGVRESGDSDNSLGIILTMLVIAAGYFLLIRFKTGPLATAGVAAAVLAVPVLLAYATLDPTEDETIVDSSEDSGVFDDGSGGDVLDEGDFEDDSFVESDAFSVPFSIHVVAAGSIAAWMLSYLFVPAATGRTFFLAASLFFLWLWILELVEEHAAVWVLSLPFSAFLFPFYAFAGELGADPEIPDPSTIGALSLIVGLGYYGIAYALDRGRRRGMATPFLVAGLLATAIGVGHLGGDLQAVGSGILLVIVGTFLGLYGATQNRRFTTWAWVAGIGLGVLLIIVDGFDDNAAGFGVFAMLAGAGVVALAALITDRFSEPDEMQPGPSRFTPRGPGSGGRVVTTVTSQGYGAPGTGWATPATGQPAYPPTGPQPVPPQPPQAPPAQPQPPQQPPQVPPTSGENSPGGPPLPPSAQPPS